MLLNAFITLVSCDNDGEVRLQGSVNEHRGVVEVCLNGTWGTVCSTNWDSVDASVVCKQLGYSRYYGMCQSNSVNGLKNCIWIIQNHLVELFFSGTMDTVGGQLIWIMFNAQELNNVW